MADDAVIDSPIGRIRLQMDNNSVIGLQIGDSTIDLKLPASQSCLKAAEAIQGYFQQSSQFGFKLALKPSGTPFQRRVWDCLLEIRPGTTQTYGEIAARLHSSARAVGNACRCNPIPLIIPCHRVVSAKGLGGYNGQVAVKGGLKDWLLRYENAI